MRPNIIALSGLVLLLMAMIASNQAAMMNTVNGDVYLTVYRDHRYIANISTTLSLPEGAYYYTLIGRYNTSMMIIDVDAKYNEPVDRNTSILVSMNRTNQVIHYKKIIRREPMGTRGYYVFNYTVIDKGVSLLINGSIILNTTNRDTVKGINISLAKLSLVKTRGEITTNYTEKNNYYILVIKLEALEIPRKDMVSHSLTDIITYELQECIGYKLTKLILYTHMKGREIEIFESMQGDNLILITTTDSYIIPVYRGLATDSYLGIAPVNTSTPYSVSWTSKLKDGQLVVDITVWGLVGDKAESIVELVRYYHSMLRQGHKLVLKGEGLLLTYDGEDKESITIYPDTDISRLSIKYVGEETNTTTSGGEGVGDMMNYIIYGVIALGIVVILGYLLAGKHT